jgi:hypothetical protein
MFVLVLINHNRIRFHAAGKKTRKYGCFVTVALFLTFTKKQRKQSGRNNIVLCYLSNRYNFMQITREGGPKNNRNLNVACELKVVALCAARCRVSTQYCSSLPRGASLG